MSIEQTLERIAVALEKLDTRLAAIDANANTTGPVAAPAPVAPAPVAPAPVAPAPTNVAPFPPQAAPTPAPGPQAAPAPMSQPASVSAVNITGLLDQIRDAANNFHRAHPERAGEVWQILSAIGAQKIDAIPPQNQAQVLAQIQALGA